MLQNELSSGWHDGLMKKEKEELVPTGKKNQDPYCTVMMLCYHVVVHNFKYTFIIRILSMITVHYKNVYCCKCTQVVLEITGF